MYLNHDIYEKFKVLEKLFDLMVDPIFNRRVDCIHVLNAYNEWSIDINYVKSDNKFETTVDLIKQCNCKFF